MKIPMLFILATVGVVVGVAMICDGYYGNVKVDEEINPVVSKEQPLRLRFYLASFRF